MATWTTICVDHTHLVGLCKINSYGARSANHVDQVVLLVAAAASCAGQWDDDIC